MTDWDIIATRISAQPPAVDFIENRLPRQLPAFQNHNLQYDRDSDSWVPMSGAPGITVSAPVDQTSNSSERHLGPRSKPPGDIGAMTFWSSIFGAAMTRFINRFPKRPKDKGYDIRCKGDWGGVFTQLDAARHFYLEKRGIKGTFINMSRKAADNIQPAVQAVQFVPDVDYTTPVLGAVKILLGASQVAADTRDQVVHGFDDLDQIFSEIELFLQEFPQDYKVQDTCTNLIMSTFKAIELAIQFFTSSTGRRVGSAIFYGEKYQKPLRDSLADIKTCSQQLVQDALSSHIHHTRHAMLNIINDLKSLKRMYEALLRVQDGQQTMVNTMHSLLMDYKRKCKRRGKKNRHLRAELNRVQSRTVSPAPTVIYFINKDDLLNFIDIPNFEEDDMQRILDKNKRLDPEQQMQTENVVQNQQFKNWLVSTSSQILLIHGDFREGNQRISALSLFCTTLTAALRADQNFLPLVFYCGSHLEDDPCAGGLLMITSLVVQLLSQQSFDMRGFPQEVYEDLKQWGDIAALCLLFRWLLCQLPNDVTVFCLIDGAVYYERDQFIDGMSEVLAKILDMTMDGSLPVTAKVLVTSPTPTTLVRLPFEVKGSLLSVGAMPSRRWGSSQLRLQREMGEELGDS